MKLLAISDIGVSRSDNQDNYWCSRLEVNGVEVGVMCLCDGMGGMNKGGLASKIVTESVRDYFSTKVDLDGLVGVIQNANKRILDIGAKEGRALGTTCTIIVCSGGNYSVLHVGDTRCYRVRGDEYVQITTDHSALTKYGITYDNDPEMYNKYKNKLTRCIGVKSLVKIDRYEGSYLDGDTFIVCSDGFWHYLDCGNKIEDFTDLESLVKSCIDGGELDNITIGVLEV